MKEEVQDVLKRMNAKGEIEIEKVRRGEKMVLVRVDKWKQKMEAIKKRAECKSLKKIEDDLTWIERNIRYKLRQVTEEKRSNGSKPGLSLGK